MTITVLLVDDHPIVRTGLRSLLDKRSEISVIAEASSGEEAIELCQQLSPDVVLCDLRLGDGLDGVGTTAALRQQTAPPAVLILTTFDRDAEVLGAIEAGAAGYLLKDVAPDTIVAAIHKAAAGQQVLAPDLAERVASNQRRPRVRLTERELEVLRLLDSGSSRREIAKTLFVTEATVKTHLVHIFDKLHVNSRASAVAIARETGLI